MNPLVNELDRYLTIRRSLGFVLVTDERILRAFIAFADKEGDEYISTALFLKWKSQFGNANRQTWAGRLRAIRIFARWLHGIDSRHEIPPDNLIPGRNMRARPYIYSQQEINDIVSVASQLVLPPLEVEIP